MFKTKTKTFIFVLEAPRDQDPGPSHHWPTNAMSSSLCVQSSPRIGVCDCRSECRSVCGSGRM